MIEIELRPTLEHCIQTQSKKEYEQLMYRILESANANIEDGQRLELLKSFLETIDFNKIRSEYEPFLANGKQVVFKLWPGHQTTEYRWEVR